jgi:hypothetical protein
MLSFYFHFSSPLIDCDFLSLKIFHHFYILEKVYHTLARNLIISVDHLYFKILLKSQLAVGCNTQFKG